jgi:opacity protein-like surface antigen
MKKLALVTAVVAMCAVSGVVARAGVEQGMNEVSVLGDLHLLSQNEDSRATASAAVTYNRYVMDNVSVGADLKFISAQVYTGENDAFSEDVTEIYVMGRSDYYFMPESDMVPYVGLRLGLVDYMMGSDSWATFAYGAQGGMKWFVVENVSVNLELSYTAFTLTDAGTEDDSMGDLGIQIGASLFF